jgi:hypothetical protein
MTFSALAATVENPYKGKNRFLVETLDEALADCARASASTRKKSKVLQMFKNMTIINRYLCR